MTGVKTFVPTKILDNEYETFERLIERSNEWICQVNGKKKKKSSQDKEDEESDRENKSGKTTEMCFDISNQIVLLNVQSLLVQTQAGLN